MSLTTVLRVTCDGCSRNLVDVKHGDEGELQVIARSSATLTRYGHERAEKPVPLPDPLQALLGRDGSEVIFDKMTYTVHCRCGRNFARDRAAFEDAWTRRAASGTHRVVHATVGPDL